MYDIQVVRVASSEAPLLTYEARGADLEIRDTRYGPLADRGNSVLRTVVAAVAG